LDRQPTPVTYEPPAESVYRHAAIARLIESRNPSVTHEASRIYDSWSGAETVAMRDDSFHVERRMRFTCGQVSVELVVEHQGEIWDCVARVYRRNRPVNEFILQVGRIKHFARAYDCYRWTSPQPPKRLCLLSADERIELGRLSW
jgi:hypothetical protein